MAEIEKHLRYRINISTSVKGIKTYDCTVDFEQGTSNMPEIEALKSMEDTLLLSDKLVAELDRRYPAVVEEPKEKK